MSKTTPEEAIALVRKHQIDGIWTAPRILGLAALIDEVRRVDAEPVAMVSPKYSTELEQIVGKRIAFLKDPESFSIGTMFYTHPAPSQPAAPVEPTLKRLVADSKETSGEYWKSYTEGLAEDFDALAAAYTALKTAAPVELPVVAKPNWLCYAYGESDHPVAEFAFTRDDVARFLCEQWFGITVEEAPDNEDFIAAMEEFDNPEWDLGDSLSWEFEIGGLNITRLTAQAAIAAGRKAS